MPDGADLEVAAGADDGALAVPLDGVAVRGQRIAKLDRQIGGKRVQRLGEPAEIVLVPSGIGILDDRRNRPPAARFVQRGAAGVVDPL